MLPIRQQWWLSRERDVSRMHTNPVSQTTAAEATAPTPAATIRRSRVRKEDEETVRRMLELLETAHPTQRTIHDLFQSFQRISPGWTFYERVKTTLVLICLVPFRLIYLVLAGSIILLVAKLALLSHSVPKRRGDEDGTSEDDALLFKPLSKWRRMLLSLSFPLVRSILFVTFGIYHIRHKRQAKFSPAYYKSERNQTTDQAYLIVANHLGYIDILILMYSFRGSFVAKGECENTPVIGVLARALQCMFVHKGQSLTSQLVTRVKSTWDCHQKQGHQPSCRGEGCITCMTSLVIFPEGTTTNGHSMIPFRTGVFNGGVALQPICIQFPYKHFNLSWETIRFREHLFRTLTQVVNHVECIELPVYVPNVEEIDDAKTFSRHVQYEMGVTLDQPIVPLNRKMKLLYHSYLMGKVENEAEVLKQAKLLLEQDESLMDFIKYVLPEYHL